MDRHQSMALVFDCHPDVEHVSVHFIFYDRQRLSACLAYTSPFRGRVGWVPSPKLQRQASVPTERGGQAAARTRRGWHAYRANCCTQGRDDHSIRNVSHSRIKYWKLTRSYEHMWFCSCVALVLFYCARRPPQRIRRKMLVLLNKYPALRKLGFSNLDAFQDEVDTMILPVDMPELEYAHLDEEQIPLRPSLRMGPVNSYGIVKP